jgi:hypothetical protein
MWSWDSCEPDSGGVKKHLVYSAFSKVCVPKTIASNIDSEHAAYISRNTFSLDTAMASLANI